MTITHRTTADSSFSAAGKTAWDEEHTLPDASEIPFAQSGIGAQAEPVQTALRRLLFAGQYGSVANFNTARAAHTGTVALPPTSQFANLDATATTPFALISGGATFNGTYDPVYYIGYNISGANGNTKITSAEPMMKLSFEADFNDGSNHLMEFNLDYTSDDDLVTRRPIYVTIGRSAGAQKNAVGMVFTYGDSRYDIAHTDGTTVFRFHDSKSLTINGLTEVSGVKVLINGDVIRQRNESASRYRADHQITSGGLQITAFDDTGGAALPVLLSSLQLSINTIATVAGVKLLADSAIFRQRNDAATRYRADRQITSGGVAESAFDDIGGVFLPGVFDFLPAIFNLTSLGNMGLGTLTFGTNATLTFGVKTGTAPTTGVADTVQLYSSDNSAGNTIPSFFCEGAEVLATEQADSASSVRVRMRINGTVVTLLAI